ncbi:MAG: FAD-dependent oxidoreductase [Pseudomonadota bacterium]
MTEWLKNLIRPLVFQLRRLRGYPGLDYYRGRIIDIRREYGQVHTFRVTKPEGLDYQAGQYIHLVAPRGYINPNDVRHMSFASAPDESALLFSMNLDSSSRYKQRFANARVGDAVGLFKVRGQFTLANLGDDDPVLYIAGGIGITPIRSLVQSQPDRPWQLVYAGNGYCFVERWQSPEHTRRVNMVTRKGLFGAIDAAQPLGKTCFVCGSATFIAAVTAHLQSIGVAEPSIRIENFSE